MREAVKIFVPVIAELIAVAWFIGIAVVVCALITDSGQPPTCMKGDVPNQFTNCRAAQ